MPSFRDGSLNILALNNPGVYVDQILPSPNTTGVQTNIEGIVGVASWGPVDVVQYSGSPDEYAAIGGTAQVRTYDIGTYLGAAYQQGTAIQYATVRVTDGTDTAATSSVLDSSSLAAGRFTAKNTGSLGDQIAYAFQNTAAAGAYAAVISFPGRLPERFDNIQNALASFETTPGTGYKSVPQLNLSAPDGNIAGAVKAVAQATLVVTGTPTIGNGGVGHAVGDVVTLGAGVKLHVDTVSAGVITAVSIVSDGLITAGAVPTTVGHQTASTGSGTGAVFNLSWGLGAPVIVQSGFGYLNAPTVTIVGGQPTTVGTYTAIVSFWAALAYAVNYGTTQRGKSNYVVFAVTGSSTATPTLNTPVSLAGGTDGADGVTSSMLVGVDVSPRTGMYALRKTGIDGFSLADVIDSDTWAVQLAFAISEAALAVVATAPGTTIAETIATRASEGVDDPSLWVLVGDWPTFYDTQNGFTRLVNPAAIALGCIGNLSPEQSPINKPLIPVIGTETSQTGVIISDADESVAQNGGVDLIGQSEDLNEDYFSFLTGRNSSSNTAANGIEYTRLTNFLIKTFEKGGRSIVGRLQSIQVNDPTRTLALSTIDSILQDMVNPDSGSGGYGMIDVFSTKCDLDNNPPGLQAQGFLFLYATVRYLNVVRYFVVKLAGGGNVSVSVQSTQPTTAQFS